MFTTVTNHNDIVQWNLDITKPPFCEHINSPLALRYIRFHRIQTRLVVDLHQVDLLIAVREIICRNILSAVFGWYDMVYERSGAERHRDVLYFRGNVLVIDSLSFFFSFLSG